jgi:hypothetical protein
MRIPVIRLLVMIFVLAFTFLAATVQKIMLKIQNWHPELA